MIDYYKYINALRKCAKEHDKDRTSTGHIIVSNLCRDTANLLEEIEKSQVWIPVSERLPDTDDKVLCWYEYYHWTHGKVLPEYGLGCYLRETSSWFGEVTKGKDVRVIAWIPLPPVYMRGDKE